MPMIFEQRLNAHATLVEERLERILPGPPTAPARLARAMRHAVLGGGKRFRPFLVLETAALFGMETAAALPAACAVECVHCYSLVHDDLPAMDHDEVRRGRPAVWKAFDEWTAILAGDALLTLAFEMLGCEDAHPDPAIRADLVGGLAAAAGAGGMAGGQCLDLEMEKLGAGADASMTHVGLLQSMKTAALIRFACEAGAILGRAPTPARQALRFYGERMGVAYQMADDLLDLEGDAEVVGKTLAKDGAAGKATLVALVGRDAARTALGEAEAQAIAALAVFGTRADLLAEAARFVSHRRR
jgi:farnesyl diphosphate synthase